MNRLKLVVKVALTCILLGLLVRHVGFGDLRRALQDIDFRWLVLMYALAISRLYVMAWLMRSVLAHAGSNLSAGRIFLSNALASMYGMILPGDLIASVAKWKNLSDATQRKSVVLNAILYNRAVLLAVPVGLGVIVLWWENPLDPIPLAEYGTLGMAVVAVLAAFLWHPRLGQTTDRIVRRCLDVAPAYLSSRAEYVLASLELVRSMKAAKHLEHLLIAVGMQGVAVLGLLCVANAVHIDVPILAFVLTIAVLAVTSFLPITLGNFGIREAVFIVVLGSFGVPESNALVAGLLFGTGRLVFAGIGAAYQVALIFGWADSRSTSL